MRIRKPFGTTSDGCAFTIVSRYEGRAYVKYMASEGDLFPCTGVIEILRTIKPMNPMPDGNCRTVKYQYFKNGLANFTREGSYAATGVIEVIEDE